MQDLTAFAGLKIAAERGAEESECGFAAETAGGLSAADRELWNCIARTIRPFAETRERSFGKNCGIRDNCEHKSGVAKESFSAAMTAAEAAAVSVLSEKNRKGGVSSISAPLPARVLPAVIKDGNAQSFPACVYRKLVRGRLPIEAKMDLHNRTQAEAHETLLYFVRNAQQRGLRHILVITGKGKSPRSEGLLQKNVPHWLAAAPFRAYVASVEQAARSHGGLGAFYVRLHIS